MLKQAEFKGDRILDEVMKCPKCGGELEKGFLISNESLFWDTKTHKFFAEFSGEILASKSTRITFQNLEPYRCKNCKLVIFEYGKN
jgi:uncharacterized protein (UPF0212 family)